MQTELSESFIALVSRDGRTMISLLFLCEVELFFFCEEVIFWLLHAVKGAAGSHC